VNENSYRGRRAWIRHAYGQRATEHGAGHDVIFHVEHAEVFSIRSSSRCEHDHEDVHDEVANDGQVGRDDGGPKAGNDGKESRQDDVQVASDGDGGQADDDEAPNVGRLGRTRC
jgi:hypothetical protein